MRNPLNKRYIKELRQDAGKYVVIFLFLVITIGFVSGFLVADNSMIKAYNESFEKYNIEDGNFRLGSMPADEILEAMENEGLTIYKNFYEELTAFSNHTFRIYENREELNKVCVLEGRIPENSGEIAIDRLYGVNNDIEPGDIIEVGDKAYTVTGLVAFSDYSALFRNTSDLMLDAQKFTVAIVTKEDFQELPDDKLNYNYSWKYNNQDMTEEQRHYKGQELVKVLAQNAIAKGLTIQNFVAREDNQAIQFTGEDMGSDKAMIMTLLYIVIVIMAFIFAVTMSNTIEQEAAVIGTLRASGYKKSELVRHYLVLPVIVTVFAAIAGNILGYTCFKYMVVWMYYNSYSLPSYQTAWNWEAFISTTLVPFALMVVINIFVLVRKLSLSPLSFLRRQLRNQKSRGVIRLPQFSFMRRFQLRVILQNKGNYIVLFVGILFTSVLIMFGFMMIPLLEHFKGQVTENRICEYQYVLKSPVETKNVNAEKYSLGTLLIEAKDEEVTVFGVTDESKYIDGIQLPENSDEVLVSNTYIEKYSLHVGDSITLKPRYESDTYTFKIAGVVDYEAQIAIFVSSDAYNDIFHKEDGYFTGYFSNEKLEDIDEAYVANIITIDDLTRFAEQLDASMGDMMSLFSIFALALFLLMTYLLSKIVIEKNKISISMVKILGYNNTEVGKLFLISTAVVVAFSVFISVPISYVVIDKIYLAMMQRMNGWLPFYVEASVYIKMIVLPLVAYCFICALQFSRIRKIPMGEALKNAE